MLQLGVDRGGPLEHRRKVPGDGPDLLEPVQDLVFELVEIELLGGPVDRHVGNRRTAAIGAAIANLDDATVIVALEDEHRVEEVGGPEPQCVQVLAHCVDDERTVGHHGLDDRAPRLPFPAVHADGYAIRRGRIDEPVELADDLLRRTALEVVARATAEQAPGELGQGLGRRIDGRRIQGGDDLVELLVREGVFHRR